MNEFIIWLNKNKPKSSRHYASGFNTINNICKENNIDELSNWTLTLWDENIKKVYNIEKFNSLNNSGNNILSATLTNYKNYLKEKGMSNNIIIPPEKPFDAFKWRWAVTTPSEGINKKEVLLGVLKVLVKHNNQRHATQEFRNDLIALENTLVDSKISLSKSKDDKGKERPLEKNIIENSGQYWKALGFINTTSNGTISVTQFGMDIINNNMSDKDILKWEILNFKIPNENIENKEIISLYETQQIEIFPLKLIFQILYEIFNKCIKLMDWYITQDELIKVVIPLSVNPEIHPFIIVDNILKFREDATSFDSWPNYTPENNDHRMAKEFLLFISNFGGLDIIKIEKEDRFYINKTTMIIFDDIFNNENSLKEIETFLTEDDSYKCFLKKFKESASLHKLESNIKFIIGQPNTGKSFDFEEKQIFKDGRNNDSYKYLKIPVSGGIGNEYKGLQSTDLALTYDPIKKELRFGEFLQVLMSAIVNPNIPHVIFLDDFHNQDISSLLSEYTPLFKSQQKRDIPNIDASHEIFNQTFSSTEEFIKIWNKFIKENCLDIPKVPITNRISGESLYLVYPSNFYLLGAANFNQNSLNIFADWEDRAKIQYKQPIEDFLKTNIYQKIKDNDFFKCCLTLNNELKNILEENNIFDNEKYCFGMWKMFDYEQNLIDNPKEQKELIKFFFGMIKNSLRFNNKNSLINTIGKDLFNVMQEDSWFSKNIVTINQDLEEKEFFKILHTYNIYEEDI